MKTIYKLFILLLFFCVSARTYAQWTALTTLAPDTNGGVMLLLSDGRAMCKARTGLGDGQGKIWNILTPDGSGSYVNGSWTTTNPMTDDRLYFASQVLKDGRVYVAGGEDGSGGTHGEVYDPTTGLWAGIPNSGYSYSDANSEILEDGKVLQATANSGWTNKVIYNPSTNSYSAGNNTSGSTDESAWVKLPDGSILMVDINSTTTERFIPATGTWIGDDPTPVNLYDPYGQEAGAGFLLPDGRAFFLGSLGHTAYYTPSGSTAHGSWTAGPDIPNSQGTPDAAAAMMPNGIILCAVSDVPTSGNHFPSPTSFYEFDYTAGPIGTFTQVNAPAGGLTAPIGSFSTNMLVLPTGQVLYAQQEIGGGATHGSVQYYVYTPSGSPLSSGKPKINSFSKCGKYMLFGTLFNGISEGAAYGDDWQMASNYPIVQLKDGSNIYYCRTLNWNSTGVQRGSSPDYTEFTLPAGLPMGPTYELRVIANGNASDPISVSDFTISNLSVPALTLSNHNGYNISCSGGSDGTATANPSGGIPAYSYLWSDGQTTAMATGLSATTYSVVVTDAFGCTGSASATLTDPPLLSTTAASTIKYNGYDIRCHGGNDGAAAASPTGGVLPYTYNWSNGQSTNPATSLTAGTYTVTVTDANGCSTSASVTLTEPPQLTIDAGPNKTVYYGYPDSSCATLNSSGAGGGVPPYTLTWSTGSHASSINVCPNTTTIYYLTITDANNCSLTDSVRVCVIDVRCGNKLQNVTICHVTGSHSNPYETICLALPGARSHFLNHPGDQLAACGTIKTCTFPVVLRPDNSGEEAINTEDVYLRAFPNPFSEFTTVRFKLPEDGRVMIKVFDISGREMTSLFDGETIGGNIYDVTFDGSLLSNGMYFLTLKTESGATYVRNLVLTK